MATTPSGSGAYTNDAATSLDVDTVDICQATRKPIPGELTSDPCLVEAADPNRPECAGRPYGPRCDPQWRPYSPAQACYPTFPRRGTANGWNVLSQGNWACQTSNCSSLARCKIENIHDVRAFACQSFWAGRSCWQAWSQSPDGTRLDANDKRTVRWFYECWAEKEEADCSAPPSTLQQTWLGTAVWVGRGAGEFWRPAVQILPSVSLGVPIAFFGKSTDAERALRGVSAFAGLTARFTPIAFTGSVHGFFGTAATGSSELASETYPAPFLRVFGVGVDALGGIAGLSVLHTQLAPDGALSRKTSSASLMTLSIDLTAIGLTASALGAGAGR